MVRTITRFFLIVSVIALLSACTSIPVHKDTASGFTLVYPVEKYRGEYLPVSSDVTQEISIAGNEYETALYVLTGDLTDDVEVTIVGLPPMVEVQAYYLGSIDIDKKSRWFDSSRVRGLWPDSCIPLRRIHHSEAQTEHRVAFVLPVKELKSSPLVQPGNYQVLLEFYNPSENASGTAADFSVAITHGSETLHSISSTMVFRRFSLPWIPSFRTTVDLGYDKVIRRHRRYEQGSFETDELWLEYLRILGTHRMYPFYPDPEGLIIDEQNASIDERSFNRIQGPLLDGTLFDDVPPATSLAIRLPSAIPEDPEWIQSFSQNAGEFFNGRSWFDRMYHYNYDEPLISMYDQVKSRSERYRRYFPGIKILLTEPYNALLEPEIDIWAPDIFALGDTIPFMPLYARGANIHPDFHTNPLPASYDVITAGGDELWVYTCTTAQALDYPNMFIDSTAAYQRALPWLMYGRGATGFLYWSSVYRYVGGDPWQNQYAFFTNGDGTVLYPGHPGIPGLDDHLPIASLRLKLLREGFEDYEYLVMLEQITGDRLLPESLTRQIHMSSTIFSKRIGEYQRVRERIADEIEMRL